MILCSHRWKPYGSINLVNFVHSTLFKSKQGGLCLWLYQQTSPRRTSHPKGQVLGKTINCPYIWGIGGMVDTRDLKSLGSDTVPIRVRYPPPIDYNVWVNQVYPKTITYSPWELRSAIAWRHVVTSSRAALKKQWGNPSECKSLCLYQILKLTERMV